MSNKYTINRLMKEYERIQKSTNNQFVCEPNPDTLFEWHFALYNLEDAFKGGIYHGVLQLPPEFPMKPPTLKFITPSGRFEIGQPICLSFTNFHPESWSSAQTIESMIISIISFMYTTDRTSGGIDSPASVKQRFAAQSIAHNLKNPQFVKVFKRHFAKLGIEGQCYQEPQASVVIETEGESNNSFLIYGGVVILNRVSYDGLESFKQVHTMSKRYSLIVNRGKLDRQCMYHPSQQLNAVCTYGRCEKKGAICSYCQVREHTDHLDKTWNLNHFVKQIQQQIESLQPDYQEMNQILITFRLKINEATNSIIQLFERVEKQVNQMLIKAKTKLDQDIDEIKTILTKLGKSNQLQDFSEKIRRLTNFFGIEPRTHKVFRKKAYEEVYIQKMNDLIDEHQQYFEKRKEKISKLIFKVEKKFSSFEIPQFEVLECPQFQPQQLQVGQVIENAHQNWVRSIGIFTLSETEIQRMKLSHLSQMAERDPYSKNGLTAIITTSDDMDIKIWNYSPDDEQFHPLQIITGAHQREFFGLRIHNFDTLSLQRMSSDVMCNNLIFTAEHGLIKIWDWVQKKCINEIKTQSFFTYDFELARMKELGICFAQGSKNSIHIVDFTSPAGTLLIQEIQPNEQSKDITCFCKIPTKNYDNLAVGFTNGIIKIYQYDGKLLNKIQRADQDLAFCIKYVKITQRKTFQNRVSQEMLVVGSDNGSVAAFDSNSGKLIWVNMHLHISWVRGLTSFVAKDNFSSRTIILSQAEKEESIKMIDGFNGQLLYSLNDVLDSGLRFKGLCAYQGEESQSFQNQIQLQNASIVVAGTCKGTLVILKLIQQG